MLIGVNSVKHGCPQTQLLYGFTKMALNIKKLYEHSWKLRNKVN